MHSLIPGNRYTEVTIWADTTKEYLEDRLAKVVGSQKANMRNNPRYTRHVRDLRRAIAAR
jgi:3-phenylpropionate/cinnamic acid dioxygenase small subunit